MITSWLYCLHQGPADGAGITLPFDLPLVTADEILVTINHVNTPPWLRSKGVISLFGMFLISLRIVDCLIITVIPTENQTCVSSQNTSEVRILPKTNPPLNKCYLVDRRLRGPLTGSGSKIRPEMGWQRRIPHCVIKSNLLSYGEAVSHALSFPRKCHPRTLV